MLEAEIALLRAEAEQVCVERDALEDCLRPLRRASIAAPVRAIVPTRG